MERTRPVAAQAMTMRSTRCLRPMFLSTDCDILATVVAPAGGETLGLEVPSPAYSFHSRFHFPGPYHAAVEDPSRLRIGRQPGAHPPRNRGLAAEGVTVETS